MEDFHKICRTCLEEITTDYKYLSNIEYINEEKLRLSEILTACTSIEVVENDNLPKQVCIKCEKNILNAFSFQQLCHKSDSILKSLLSQSLQPELLELKTSMIIEDARNILTCNTSKQDEVHHVYSKVENLSRSYWNECINDLDEAVNDSQLIPVQILKQEIDHDERNWGDQEHSSYNFNGQNQENVSSLSYRAEEKETTHKELHRYIEDETLQPLSSLKNENNSSYNYHIEPVDSQPMELKLNSISAEHTIKQDKVNNLDETINAQLTSIKILKEDNENDETNFGDQEHIDSVSYSSNENYENDLLPDYHAGVQKIDPNEELKKVEDETLQQEGSFSCEKCGQAFAQSSSLLEHMKSHPNVRNYLCTVCDKNFAEFSHLLAHINTHNKVESHKCRKCNKRLTSARSLASHMQIHTEQKKFFCKFCKKCFARASYLTIHEQSHTGNKCK